MPPMSTHLTTLPTATLTSYLESGRKALKQYLAAVLNAMEENRFQ